MGSIGFSASKSLAEALRHVCEAMSQVDAPTSALLQTALPMLEEPKEDEEPQPVKIPSYIIVPLIAIMMASFAGMRPSKA